MNIPRSNYYEATVDDANKINNDLYINEGRFLTMKLNKSNKSDEIVTINATEVYDIITTSLNNVLKVEEPIDINIYSRINCFISLNLLNSIFCSFAVYSNKIECGLNVPCFSEVVDSASNVRQLLHTVYCINDLKTYLEHTIKPLVKYTNEWFSKLNADHLQYVNNFIVNATLSII